MYTTAASHAGILSAQYAQPGSYGNADRSNLLANLRRPSPGPQYPAAYPGQQQQQLYDMQQQQMEMEIARMQLQNLELQKQLLMQAAVNAQQQAQQYGGSVRRDRQSTAPGQGRLFDRDVVNRDWRSSSPQHDVSEDGSRQEALQTLQRAQRQRHASAGGLPSESNLVGRGWRLSFGGAGDGGAGLLESARARNHLSSEPPSSPVTTTQAPIMSTPPPQSIKAFTSPPQPTLVLSKPGEAFPQTSPSPPRINRHVKTDSHSSSASSTSDHSSSDSEPHSFESAATSVGNQSIEAGKAKLNASAAAFTPSCVVAPPSIMSPPSPPRPVVAPYRSKYAALANKGDQKVGSMIIRQPRGPAPDEELATKNFASRIRRRAIGAIFRGRLSFIAPESPVVEAPEEDASAEVFTGDEE